MVGWHHQLNRHESEQALGVGDGRGSLVCYSPWGHKESDTIEQLCSTVGVFLMVSGWRKLISQIIFDLNHVKTKSRVTILKCRLQVKNLFLIEMKLQPLM